ncbi:hypothetical protein EVAR_72659_1 [Eumeta japonica]|uniref:Uncharacterized protein n=1 Tax=Eumeta variegata TaxID=151549 RepID=A0A4C1SW44_EUMVA|nr:hypothetical protein EVAR_72659_1 [Eumeta japonica]
MTRRRQKVGNPAFSQSDNDAYDKYSRAFGIHTYKRIINIAIASRVDVVFVFRFISMMLEASKQKGFKFAIDCLATREPTESGALAHTGALQPSAKVQQRTRRETPDFAIRAPEEVRVAMKYLERRYIKCPATSCVSKRAATISAIYFESGEFLK